MSVTSRPARGRGQGDRDALLAARAVADETHRIERLTRSAGGDEDAPAGEVLRLAASRRARPSTISSGSDIRPGPESLPVS